MDGFSLFLKTIPLNLYALLTLAFLIWLMAADFDFGPMKKYELAHKDDDLSLIEETHVVAGSGKVYDLILPISVLIVLCIAGMLYTGGILEGANIVEAFANCDSSTALVLGSFFTCCLPLCCTSRARCCPLASSVRHSPRASRRWFRLSSS